MSVVGSCESYVNPIQIIILQIHDCENDFEKKKKKSRFLKIYPLTINIPISNIFQDILI